MAPPSWELCGAQNRKLWLLVWVVPPVGHLRSWPVAHTPWNCFNRGINYWVQRSGRASVSEPAQFWWRFHTSKFPHVLVSTGNCNTSLWYVFHGSQMWFLGLLRIWVQHLCYIKMCEYKPHNSTLSLSLSVFPHKVHCLHPLCQLVNKNGIWRANNC